MIDAQHAAPSTADREIVATRLLDAPRDLVFTAWTDPAHVGAWWGPDGFTTTTLEMDVRPGGTWRFVMHGPDGTDYPNRVDYEQVVRPERLVYTHGDDGAGLVRPFHVTVTFDDEGGRTRLTLRMLVESTEAMRRMREIGAVEGAHQTLGRLAAHLPSM